MPTQDLCTECCHPRPGRHKTRCETQLRELFTTIDEREPLLSVIPTRVNALGEGATRGFVSQPPINLTARAHQDPQSKPWKLGPDDVEHPTLSVYATETYWRRKAAEVGGDYRDIGWVVHQPWIADMVADLRTLAAQLLAATGDPIPRSVGRCRRVTGITDRALVYCGEPMYMPVSNEPRGDDEPIGDLPEIVCPRPGCGATYTAAGLIRLKLGNEEPHQESVLVSSREGMCERAGGGNDGRWRAPSVNDEVSS